MFKDLTNIAQETNFFPLRISLVNEIKSAVFLRICSHLQKRYLLGNIIFFAQCNLSAIMLYTEPIFGF